MSNHTIWAAFGFLHSQPLFWMGVAILLFIAFLGTAKGMLRKIGLEKEEVVSEGIGKYSQMLNQDDRQWIVTEEEHMRQKHGISMLSDDFFRRVKAGAITSLLSAGDLQNVVTYDILANPKYEEDFQYYPAEDRTEEDEVFDSDTVRKVLHMPYLTREQIDGVHFESGIKQALQGILEKKGLIASFGTTERI